MLYKVIDWGPTNMILYKPFYIRLRIKLYKMHSCIELFKPKDKGLQVLEKNSKPF